MKTVRSLALLRLLLLPLLLAAFLPQRAPALDLPMTEVTARLHVRRADETLQAALVIDIAPGWKLYHRDLGPDGAFEIPSTVTLKGQGVTWSDLRWPDPKKHVDDLYAVDGVENWRWVHEGRIVLYAVGQSASGTIPADFGATLDGMICGGDGSCLPFTVDAQPTPAPEGFWASFPQDLTFGSGTPAATAAAATAAAPPGGPGEAKPSFTVVGQTNRGFWSILALAFLAGMLLNVMPCVLPVIGIRVMSLVEQAGETRGRSLALGAAFAAGVIAVFLALGGLAAAFRIGWGEQFESQNFLLVMIGAVFAFSLWLLGVFEIHLPGAVGGIAAKRSTGLTGTFVMGALATVLATPCSGPFLGTTLAWTLQQDTATILLVFLTMGLGMACPYLLLTAHPALLKKLPRPGAWMNTFKKLTGFLLVGTALYLMRALRPDLLLPANVFLLGIGMGAWLLGHYGALHQPRTSRLLALAGAALAIGGGWTLAFDVVHVPMEAAKIAVEKDGWSLWTPERFEKERQAGRTILVKWTADWCTNCKVNERLFRDPEIRKALEDQGVVTMVADVTHASPETSRAKEFRARAGGRAVPFVAIFPGDRPQKVYALPDLLTQEQLLDAIREATGASAPSP